jgi:glycosyltransferase involved in cell wall biosynthesis
MQSSLVSVIVACRNDASSLGNLFEDLNNLTYQDFQLIIVDDGSTDDTRIVLEGLCARRPRTETILLDHNVGVARARNHALTLATGQYVWFVDSDDRLVPQGLFHMAQAAVQANADVVFARAWEFSTSDGASRAIDGLVSPGAIDIDAVALAVARGELRGFLWSKLIRRACIPRDVFPDVTAQSDFLGLMKILERTDVHWAIEEVVYNYVRAGSSITSRTDPLETLLRSEEAFTAFRRRRSIRLPEGELSDFHSVFVVLAALDTLVRNGLLDRRNRLRVRAELQKVSWSSLLINRSRYSVTTVRLIVAKTNLRVYVAVSRWARRARRG